MKRKQKPSSDSIRDYRSRCTCSFCGGHEHCTFAHEESREGRRSVLVCPECVKKHRLTLKILGEDFKFV